MSETTNTGSPESFALTGAWKILSESAKQNDVAAFGRAATYLDMSPTVVLRGLAFMMNQVAMLPEGDVPEREIRGAMQTTAEIMSLVAVMLEHQNEEPMVAMMSEHRNEGERP